MLRNGRHLELADLAVRCERRPGHDFEMVLFVDVGAAAGQVEVRDSVGNILHDGDQVVLVKDLDVKGAGKTLKVRTVIKSIRLNGDPQEIDCRHEAIKGLVLRAEFVRKR